MPGQPAAVDPPKHTAGCCMAGCQPPAPALAAAAGGAVWVCMLLAGCQPPAPALAAAGGGAVWVRTLLAGCQPPALTLAAAAGGVVWVRTLLAIHDSTRETCCHVARQHGLHNKLLAQGLAPNEAGVHSVELARASSLTPARDMSYAQRSSASRELCR
jgi:hypothetical protein